MPGMIWMLVADGLLLTFFSLALILKLLDSRKFRHWLVTEGKIVSCNVKTRKNMPGDSRYDKADTELIQVPSVEYEYEMDGKPFRGSRVSMMVKEEDLSLKATLARYPVGSKVQVYYDPTNHENAALERNFRKSDYLGFGIAMCACLLVPWILGIFFSQLFHWIEPRLVNPNQAPFVTGIVAFGLLVLLMAVGSTIGVLKSWAWPSVRGRIISSRVDSFHVDTDESSYTTYKPNVIFQYEFGGQEFTGDRVNFSFVLSGMDQKSAKTIVNGYRVNDEVRVYCNPRNPSDSVLRRKGRGVILFWVIAACFGAAIWGLIPFR